MLLANNAHACVVIDFNMLILYASVVTTLWINLPVSVILHKDDYDLNT